MNIESGRRKFLQFMAAAPVAIPVAAKEAASKMGLLSVLNAGGMQGVPIQGYPAGYAGVPSALLNERESILKQLVRLKSKEEREDRKASARMQAVVLDADLASCRSMSPAAARAFQIGRNVDRHMEQERRWLERRLSELTGGLL